MEFIDLFRQQERIRSELEKNINRVLDHGRYILGPEVGAIEEKLADYVGVRHAISCSSGTDALLMALLAHGVGPGHAVFTSPFTFFASGEVISLIGATPVFVDVDEATFNIDPDELDRAIDAAEGEDAIPKGIVPVNLFGVPADYERINAIAQKHGLFVIEDAAQSFGAIIRGKVSGGLAEIGCTSFFPAKPLGCYGDGGMCFTNDSELASIIRSVRVHGEGVNKYDNVRIGLNGRMDTLQAAVLLAKLEIFPEELELRQRVADRYGDLLSDRASLTLQKVPQDTRSAWAQYAVVSSGASDRREMIQSLGDQGIPTAIYYPKPLHLQEAFSYLGYEKGAFPVSERLSDGIFSLPMHPYLTEAEQERIVAALL
jgi:dTDP-4-amino-4,6-dideoxygalactose transaminase